MSVYLHAYAYKIKISTQIRFDTNKNEIFKYYHKNCQRNLPK